MDAILLDVDDDAFQFLSFPVYYVVVDIDDFCHDFCHDMLLVVREWMRYGIGCGLELDAV